MKILMILPYIPYPTSNGGRVRSYHLLLHLCEYNDVDLVCFIKPGEKEGIDHLKKHCSAVYPIDRPPSPSLKQRIKLTLSIKPMYVGFFTNANAKNIISDLICRNYDIIHVETYYTMFNLPKQCDVPVILVESNIEYILMEQMAKVSRNILFKMLFFIDYLKQQIWERRAWLFADACAAVTQNDAKIIQDYIKRNVYVIPNGIDVRRVYSVNVSRNNSKSLLFVGSFRYYPNVDGILYFVSEILPAIKSRHPSVMLYIAGEAAPKELFQAKYRDNINVMGYVPDLDYLYSSTSVSICPIRVSSGSRVKILESLVRGHPVVSTSIGCSGLDLQNNQHVLIADTPESFADKVCLLLEMHDYRIELSLRGRSEVMSKYSWQSSAERLLQGYNEVINKKVLSKTTTSEDVS